MVLLFIVFVSCVSYFIYYYKDARNSFEEMESMAPAISVSPVSQAEDFSDSESEEPVPSEASSSVPSILPQFQNLYAQNSDLIGWVKIEGTNINYPVMFTPNDAEFYLHRNFQKNDETRGLPFLDGGTILGQSSNYIIYGHDMKDGTEFADITKYASKSYWKNHPVIQFSTIYETGEYTILAAFYSQIYNQDDTVFKYYQFNYPADADQYQNFVDQVKKLSLYDTGVTAQYGEQLLTLSTCTYQTKNGRLAVVAKKTG